MEANHELGWEQEFSPKFGIKSLPGSRAARHCSFGITESIGALIASTLVDVGVGSATAGILGTGLADAGIGALGSAVTGGNPLVGAATGGLGGIGGGLASNLGLGSALGIGSTAGSALGGAAGGALGAGLTGGNILTGALGGGAAGYSIGSNGLPTGAGPVTPTPTPATGLGGGSTSAVSSALPGSGGGLGGTITSIPDLTTGATIPGQGFGTLANPGVTATNTALGVSPAAAAIPAAASTAAPAADATASTGGGIGSSILSGIEKNPLQAVNTVLGITQANQQQKALENTVKTVNNLASSQTAGATSLENALTTGKLPPGAQAAVDQATKSAKAQVRAKYAGLGLTGSTMETQELNSIDQQAAGQIFSLADQLYQTGISQSGLTTQLYDAILQAQGGLSNQYRSALTGYSAAIAGGPYAPNTPTTA